MPYSPVFVPKMSTVSPNGISAIAPTAAMTLRMGATV
jgi:hypothetical protein